MTITFEFGSFGYELRQRLLADRYGNWRNAFPPQVLDELIDRIAEEADSYIESRIEEETKDRVGEATAEYESAIKDLNRAEEELAEWKTRRQHGVLRP